ncbi:hypothetical protein C3942_13370 [Solimonas fluminis]|uniref:DUF2970 domain-containing protein n=1 Tax=Solimonas fluminis TaxID=2086571 RepID=A0A2S5TE57_9GAMM|nr:DUF2970 domain-containing protein [Solimonas fluminis]PPE73260.1 hypothetical protein C3942_13370 [Solimonas fluminis]
MSKQDPATAPTLMQTFASVAASFFGVQSSRNRERDFTRGNPWHFILLGFVMTGIVALIFYGAVRLALRLAA